MVEWEKVAYAEDVLEELWFVLCADKTKGKT